MAKWYEKYLTIYGKSYKEIPDEVLDKIKTKFRPSDLCGSDCL